MNWIHLLSLRYPADRQAQTIFKERVDRFFSYSVSNMISLTFGAVLIALVLSLMDGERPAVLLHLLVTSSITLSTFALSQYVKIRKPAEQRLARILQLRVLMGCLIGLMYGVAVFLLPADNADIGFLLLLVIYLVCIAVAIFQYSVIPVYYALFNISIFLPLFIYLALHPGDLTLVLTILLISAMVVYISKGSKVSRCEIGAIEVKLNLQKEISEHIVTRKKLQEMALYDNLTKVANRYLFEKSSASSLERAREHRQPLALLYIDLNKFKEINDRYGHSIGDKVLIESAERIRSVVRSSDLVARVGGDEFTVVLENYDCSKVKVDLVANIATALNSKIIVDDCAIELKASIGIANFPRDGESMEELLHVADSRMYIEKNGTDESASLKLKK